MKLIKRTYLITSIWLLPVTIIGSIFCFFMIEYISYEETDEFLTYEMERLIRYHDENHDLPEFHKVADIIPDLIYEKPLFKDTLLLESGDNEMVPYRELYFTINHKNKPFTIVLRHLLLGRDDIAEGTLLIIVGVIFLIATFLVIILNIITQKLWLPFYDTLKRISNYTIGDSPPELISSKVDEFIILNKSLTSFIKKIDSDLKRNKEFHENLSHELQTQLAIIRSTTENIINQKEKPYDLSKVSGLKSIYSSANKLYQVQKSLMLLSKIGNLEYNKATNIDFKQATEQILEKYNEAFNLRNITVTATLNDCNLVVDSGLMEIMANNLIKNALKHNIESGYATIQLIDKELTIENSGLAYEGKPESRFQRFNKGESGNYGIGLSIVKQICDLYDYDVSYTIVNKSIHIIKISFPN